MAINTNDIAAIVKKVISEMDAGAAQDAAPVLAGVPVRRAGN